MLILAIDPGIKGAVAVYNDIYDEVSVYTPSESQRMICDFLDSLDKSQGIKAYIEKVHSMPKEGVKSVWTFSGNYHSWTMGFICFEIPFEEIAPREWQSYIKFLPKEKKARKLEIKRQMENLYPHLKVTLQNADALAILTAVLRREKYGKKE